MYRTLAKKYGWGPEVVKKLTRAQMRMYIANDEAITFRTEAEYNAWLARQRR